MRNPNPCLSRGKVPSWVLICQEKVATQGIVLGVVNMWSFVVIAAAATATRNVRRPRRRHKSSSAPSRLLGSNVASELGLDKPQ